MGDNAEKTEKATPKKRRDERKKGHVAISRDVVAVATLLAAIVMLRVEFSAGVSTLAQVFSSCLSLVASGEELSQQGTALWMTCVSAVARVVGPVLLAVVLLGVVATMAQTRMLVSTEPLKPKLEKINPIKGFKRLFSLNSLIEVLKNVLKICILLVLIYTCIADLVSVAEQYLYADLTGACTHLFQSIFSMMLKIFAAFLVIAAADFGYQWWDYERQMKMTKHEIKEEFKQTEGDPQIKSKIKQKQREMSQSRMMEQVPQSDVVVRNPTHYAVALRYHPGEDSAPVVMAKGEDHLALRIVEVAEQHGVTVMENVELARALYARAELNHQIPPDLYEAVAEIMVYLYNLGKLKPAKEDGSAPS